GDVRRGADAAEPAPARRARTVCRSHPMTAGFIHVRRPGLLTTVQDLGRWGHQEAGVPVAGPMDTYSHRLANLLVGNGADAATLEITLLGRELEFDCQTTIAVCGADFDITCDGHALPLETAVNLAPGA